jgi:hypothetical protein
MCYPEAELVYQGMWYLIQSDRDLKIDYIGLCYASFKIFVLLTVITRISICDSSQLQQFISMSGFLTVPNILPCQSFCDINLHISTLWMKFHQTLQHNFMTWLFLIFWHLWKTHIDCNLFWLNFLYVTPKCFCNILISYVLLQNILLI